MASAYETARSLPILWVAIVLAAPLMEEAFFRGFLFQGMQQSRIGPAGATLITSVLWAGTHVQYDAYDIGTIFVLGLVLGAARWRTGSIYTPTLMHLINNALAMANAAWYLSPAANGA